MEYVHSPLVGILGAMLIFGLAVFSHEFGHFIVAKLTGVPVKEFAIGMGPKIYSRWIGSTEYSIRCLPVGGFVRMGEADKEPTAEPESSTQAGTPVASAANEDKNQELDETVMEDLDALRGKPTLVKVAILAAGVSMNFVAAMVAIGIAGAVGEKIELPLAPAQIAEVSAKSPLYKEGFRTLDTIVSINGQAVKDWDDLASDLAPADHSSAKKWSVAVRRDGQNVTLAVPPLTVADIKDENGLSPALPSIIAAVLPTTPASRAVAANMKLPQTGLFAGDRIIAVNDHPVQYFYQMRQYILSNRNQALKLDVKRAGIDKTLLFYPVIGTNPEKPDQGQLGVLAGTGRFEWHKEPLLISFANAPLRTYDEAKMIAGQTFATLGKLFTHFNAYKTQLGGPVAIIGMAYQSSRSGFQSFINLFVFLNLALMIFNLLPIPVLDGGYIALFIIEAILRRQVPKKVLNQTLTFVTILLICAVLLLTYQDIKTWIFQM